MQMPMSAPNKYSREDLVGPLTHRVIRAAFTSGWHMLDCIIRICNYSKMCSLMAFLTTNFFTGWFSKTFRCRLLKTVTGRWFGTVQ